MATLNEEMWKETRAHQSDVDFVNKHFTYDARNNKKTPIKEKLKEKRPRPLSLTRSRFNAGFLATLYTGEIESPT